MKMKHAYDAKGAIQKNEGINEGREEEISIQIEK
jgi:hypothetical protein